MDAETKSLQCLDSSVVAGGWDHFVRSFLAGYFELHPTFAAGAGRHDYDGRLPDWSPEALAHEAAWLRAERARAEEFDPCTLDERRAFEREMIQVVVDSDLFWLEAAEWPRRNPLFYAGSLDPSLYLTRDYAPLPQRMRAFVDWARAVPRAAGQVRANLLTPMPRPHAELGEMTFGGLAGYLETDVPPLFAEVDDPDLQADFQASSAAAAQALRDLGAWFHAQIPPPGEDGGDFRLGPDLFARMLRETERVDVPLTELEAAGRRELERNLEALRGALAAFAPGVPVAEALARVSARIPAVGRVEAARRQLAGLRRFVEEAGLVSIPVEEEALIADAPPTSAGTRRTSTSPAPTTATCRPSTTSRRRTPPGRRPSRSSTSPTRRTSCSSPSTRSGPATSCSSCIRTAPSPSWRACS